jgi:4-hydroxyacetophenone monooxygenase
LDEHFSQRAELRAYFERCATRHGVRPHIRFRTEVDSLRWDEGRVCWQVRLRTADGETEQPRAQLGDDDALLAQATPSYPPFGKRMLQEDRLWLRTLRRENVDLVIDAIERITPSVVVARGGGEHPLDVLVSATAFRANRFLWPMEVTGRDGVDLRGHGGDDPRAYLGITVPGFPNLFCLYGPGTNLAHAGSMIFHSEFQVRWVMGCLAPLGQRKARILECRSEVCDAFDERLQVRMQELVWSHPGMDSWYENRRGRATTTSAWRLVDYWRWTRSPDLADFHLW